MEREHLCRQRARALVARQRHESRAFDRRHGLFAAARQRLVGLDRRRGGRQRHAHRGFERRRDHRPDLVRRRRGRLRHARHHAARPHPSPRPPPAPSRASSRSARPSSPTRASSRSRSAATAADGTFTLTGSDDQALLTATSGAVQVESTNSGFETTQITPSPTNSLTVTSTAATTRSRSATSAPTRTLLTIEGGAGTEHGRRHEHREHDAERHRPRDREPAHHARRTSSR